MAKAGKKMISPLYVSGKNGKVAGPTGGISIPDPLGLNTASSKKGK